MHIFWWRLTFKWRMSQDSPPRRQLQMGQRLHEFLVQSRQRSHRQGKRGQQGLMATGSEAIGLGGQETGQPAGHVVHVGHGTGAHGHRGVTFWAEAHGHRHHLLKPVAWTTRQWTFTRSLCEMLPPASPHYLHRPHAPGDEGRKGTQPVIFKCCRACRAKSKPTPSSSSDAWFKANLYELWAFQYLFSEDYQTLLFGIHSPFPSTPPPEFKFVILKVSALFCSPLSSWVTHFYVLI